MNAPVHARDFSTDVSAVSSARLTIEPTSAVLGAVISGIDLRENLDAGTIAALRAALVTHKVLFFHNQDISREDHVRFGRYFGDLEGHPVTSHVEAFPEILSIKNGEYAHLNAFTIPFIRAVSKWHADVTFRPAPSLGG
ncbi:MAG TPA: TauD/TfdA family dioxygenase, partial [Verrucomicrobiae bacterium]|nr:TauD/TfdA family dioxygenase [Verrucomicrobiae bacterium]